MLQEEYEYFARHIFEAALEVHRHLGPGLLESAYQSSLELELSWREVAVSTQVKLPLFYKGTPTGKDFYIDLLVENEIILEVKAVEVLLPIHGAQLLSYLRLADKRLGFLINFNVPLIRDGFKRILNQYFL